MDNRGRLVRVVADKLNLSVREVEGVLKAQHLMFRQSIQKQEQRTLYVRKVGHFTHADLRYKLNAERIERRQQVINQREIDNEEFPLEFDEI